MEIHRAASARKTVLVDFNSYLSVSPFDRFLFYLPLPASPCCGVISGENYS